MTTPRQTSSLDKTYVREPDPAKNLLLLFSVVFLLLLLTALAPFTPSAYADESDFIGHWNLTLLDVNGYASAWLEITPAVSTNTSGRLVWIFGGAEPLEDISIAEDVLTFSHPFMGKRLRFTAQYANGALSGTATDHDSTIRWIGARAPDLRAPALLRQENPVALFTGHTLSGWTLRNGSPPSCWHAEAGILFNDRSCADLKSNGDFMNFRLALEFRLDDEGGSGVYLRGRYEVQIANDENRQPSTRSTGAIFGHLAPNVSAGKKPGEWQTLEITLIGRAVTVWLNHRLVIVSEQIPGPTGAALDSDEERPGPIMLQGDHGRVSFRNIVITPLLEDAP
ncbi:MAG: DUF1080 domain-containing protein [Nitrospira sp.]|nr:DUF1080 domain-containing protein [Nitrospira sp.]